MNDEYDDGYRDGLGDATINMIDMEKKIDHLTEMFKVSQLGVTSNRITKPNPAQKSALRFLNISNFIMALPYSIFQGFVLMKLWNWFVVPSFAAPSPGIIAWMGISLLVSTILIYLSITVIKLASTDQNDPDTRIFHALITLISWPIALSFALLVGFIYSLFL